MCFLLFSNVITYGNNLVFQHCQESCPPICVPACYPQMVQIAEKATEQQQQDRELTDHIKGVAFWPGTSLGTVTIPPHEGSQRMLALISCEWTFLQGAQESSFQT